MTGNEIFNNFISSSSILGTNLDSVERMFLLCCDDDPGGCPIYAAAEAAQTEFDDVDVTLPIDASCSPWFSSLSFEDMELMADEDDCDCDENGLEEKESELPPR